MSFKQLVFGKLFRLNWSLILVIIIVACIGFSILYSAAEGNIYPWAFKQMVRFTFLFPVMLAIALMPIRVWLKSAYVIYILAIAALLMTEFFGVTAMGATRWIRIGPINLQPSEIMKVCLVFALARYFYSINASQVTRIVYLIPPLLMIALPAILVLRQPDLGTTLILIMTGGMLFFAAGVKIWKFVVVGITAIASLPFIWASMHSYQKKRVTSFLNPGDDPLGDGYNILQSKIAIGSGGLSGKGFLKGTQSQLSFLPEKQTDFIFTMLSEEFGFIGGVVVIALYALIIMFGIIIAVNSRNHFGRLMAIGITSIFFLHVFVNIAMVMGLIPVVGAPLPLLSYGGTIMMTILVAFGLLLNVHLYADETLENKKGWR